MASPEAGNNNMLEPRKIMGGLGNRMFQFAYIYAHVYRGLIPDVWVQNFDYFMNAKEEIRNLYQAGIGERKDYVAVHIRRGDYVDNPFYVDLTSTDYYQKAFALFPNEKFIIFYGDKIGTYAQRDRKWLEEWLPKQNINYEVREEQTDIEDMNEMAACKGFIGANSSFSIWSAFININDDKKIVMPKQYYVDGVERTKYPVGEGWTII